MIANKQVVEELANTLADRIVNKMSTSQPMLTDATRALKTVRSPGLSRTFLVGNTVKIKRGFPSQVMGGTIAGLE